MICTNRNTTSTERGDVMRRRYVGFLPTLTTEDANGKVIDAKFGKFKYFSGLVESAACGLAKSFGKFANLAFHRNCSLRRQRDELWQGRVVLIPEGEPDTEFAFGFYLPGLGARTFSVFRRVSDGPFAMLDCSNLTYFYAIGNAPISLRLDKRVFDGSEEERMCPIDLY